MDAADAPGVHAAILPVGPSGVEPDADLLQRLAATPLLHRAVSKASSVSGPSVTVVLGHRARELAPALRQSSASVAVDRGWTEGLASSIRTAVRSAPPRCEGLLLLPAGQAAVTTDDLRRLLATWRRHPVLIAAAVHAGTAGLPAIFPRWALADLLELRGDRGPAVILRRCVDRVVRVPMPNAGTDQQEPRVPGAPSPSPETRKDL